MLTKNILDAWYNYAVSLVNDDVTVIFSDELYGKDAPRPQLPYMTLKIISGPQSKTIDSMTKKNAQGTFDLIDVERYTLSVQMFGSEKADDFAYIDILKSFKNQLSNPDRLEQLRAEGDIGIQSRGTVKDISALLKTGFERRATLDIIFLSSNIEEVGLESIEKVQISGKLKNEDSSAEINTEQIINKP